MQLLFELVSRVMEILNGGTCRCSILLLLWLCMSIANKKEHVLCSVSQLELPWSSWVWQNKRNGPKSRTAASLFSLKIDYKAKFKTWLPSWTGNWKNRETWHWLDPNATGNHHCPLSFVVIEELCMNAMVVIKDCSLQVAFTTRNLSSAGVADHTVEEVHSCSYCKSLPYLQLCTAASAFNILHTPKTVSHKFHQHVKTIKFTSKLLFQMQYTFLTLSLYAVCRVCFCYVTLRSVRNNISFFLYVCQMCRNDNKPKSDAPFGLIFWSG